MTNNYLLRRIRYALNLNDDTVRGCIARTGRDLLPEELAAYYRDEGEPGFRPCPDDVLEAFLDGLIIERRGPRDSAAPAVPAPLDNNSVLRKLRIALSLTDRDIIALLKSAGFDVSPSEVSALFRRREHKNFRRCHDQFMRNLLSGLTQRERGESPSKRRRRRT